MRAYLPVLLVAPLLAGCVVASVARTAVDVVSVPVKVVGKGIDAALPSQKRADEKRGRELRREDEQRAIGERCSRRRALRTDRCAPQPPAKPLAFR
jgi:hypothetical protein